MADINDRLNLEDNFSSTWDKFIDQGDKAARMLDAATGATRVFADTTEESAAYIDAAIARMIAAEREAAAAAADLSAEQQEVFNNLADASAGVADITSEATQATEAIGEMVNKIEEVTQVSAQNWGYNEQARQFIENSVGAVNGAAQVADSLNTVEMAQQAAANSAADLEAAQAAATEEAIRLGIATAQVAQEYIDQANAIVAVEPSIANYESQIRAVERSIASQNTKLQQALNLYQQTSEATGATSDETERARQAVLNLNNALGNNIEKYNQLNDELEEFINNNPADPIEETDRKSQQAANGGLEQLLRKLAKITAAYFGWRALVGAVGRAMEEERYEIRFDAAFGPENGENALAWVRQQANELGRSTQEIADSVTRFSRLTTNPENIERLTEAADKFSRFSVSGDYDQIVTGLTNALRTGNLRQLSTETGISTQALKDFGVEDALNAGDVGAFIDALDAAGAAIGITEEAYQNALNSSGDQYEKFINRIQNRAQQAARGFLDAFGPAFETLNEFLDSEQGATFFAGLQSGFEAIGTAAAYFVQALTTVAGFLADNWETVITAAALGLSIFAGWMTITAIATLAANAPILLFLGLLVAIGVALASMGVGATEVFTVIGGLFGALYNIVSNVIGNLWNIIAAFVEFFANVWNDPLGSVARLFASVFDGILGIVETVASAIDFVLGTELANGVANFRSNIQTAVEKKYANEGVSIDRWENTNFGDDVDKFADIGAALGEKLDNFDIDAFLPGGLDSLGGALGGFSGEDLIGADGAVPVKVKGDINLADEDLRMLTDLAERRYVADVNVRTLAPKLSVNVSNTTTGEPMKPQDVADVVMWTLEQQINEHSDLAYDY